MHRRGKCSDPNTWMFLIGCLVSLLLHVKPRGAKIDMRKRLAREGIFYLEKVALELVVVHKWCCLLQSEWWLGNLNFVLSRELEWLLEPMMMIVPDAFCKLTEDWRRFSWLLLNDHFQARNTNLFIGALILFTGVTHGHGWSLLKHPRINSSQQSESVSCHTMPFASFATWRWLRNGLFDPLIWTFLYHYLMKWKRFCCYYLRI